MKVIAHRGANKEALENSWTAFEKAIDANADRIELDVHVTGDRHLAILHDNSLSRTIGVRRTIEECNRSELAALRLKNGEPIPFLDEVFDRILPRCEINVEIKTPTAEAAELVCALIQKHKAFEKIVVSSFAAEPLIWISENVPQVQIACLWGSDILWHQLHLYSPLNFMQRCNAHILHPQASYVTENLMDQAKTRGWKVYPYVTMTDEDQGRENLWTHLKTLGIDGLCTNYPREFRQWLNRLETENCIIEALTSGQALDAIKIGTNRLI